MNTGEAKIVERNLRFFSYFVSKAKKNSPNITMYKSFDFVRFPIDKSVYSLLDPCTPTRFSIDIVYRPTVNFAYCS